MTSVYVSGAETVVDVPGAPTGRACGPTEEFSPPVSVRGFTFQTWWCACGAGVNAQVEPESLLPRYAREHLAGKSSSPPIGGTT